MTIEEVRNKLLCTEKGGVKQTIQNCVIALQNDPLLVNAIKRNELTGQVDIVKQMKWTRRGQAITDTDMNQIKLYLEQNYELISDKSIRSAMDIVSSENTYHPIREYLDTLEWDGQERIRYLLNTYLGAEQSEYVYQATKLLMLGAINRVYHPGCKFETMICLVGGQGAGKSTFFRFMSIRDHWFSDDLKRLDDDNVYRKMQGHWFIEMAEMLATSSAKSIEEIKSFVSRQKETYKIPYETHPEDRPRQCVFVGTSNNMNFLPFDRTGNRRFAPILIDEVKALKHPLANEKECRAYIIQCWAEAMEIYVSGNYRLAFSTEMEQELRAMQVEFMPEDTRAGVIQEWLDKYSGTFVCTRMIFKEALGHMYDEPKPKDLKEIAGIMNHSAIGWRTVSSHRFPEYGTQRAWKRLECKQNNEINDNKFLEVNNQMEIPFTK
ncbi:MAG: virulence-associated E family protein [Eubacteriales bacterium]